MDPTLIASLGGAGLGLLKQFEDQKAADRARKQEASIAQWSPWTGMAAQRIADPSLLGNVSQGALTGAAMGQGISRDQGQQQMMMNQQAQMNSMYNPNMVGPTAWDRMQLTRGY